VKTSRSFAPDEGSIPAARRFVLDTAGDVDKYRHDAIAVMTSELAMNAVQYARAEFTVTVEITGGTLRVEVTDSAREHPNPGRSRPPAASTDAACSSSVSSPTPGESPRHPLAPGRPYGSRPRSEPARQGRLANLVTGSGGGGERQA